MTVCKLSSKIWGDLGELRQVQANLYRSASGRAYLLGGNPGGKAEGLFSLDKNREVMPGLEVPRFLVLGNDVSGLPHYSIARPPETIDLDPATIVKVINTINDIGFSHALAIRSSAQVEDQIGQTAAGVFQTEFHGLPLVEEDSIRSFINKLESVYASAYTERAVHFWKRLGHNEIPPISVIIQECVGKQWEYAPRYFLPALAGITNIASRKLVKAATVVGFGLSAVDHRGLGILHKLPIIGDGTHVYHARNKYKGKLNIDDLQCLDLSSGNLVGLSYERAEKMFPKEFLKQLQWNFPGIQMDTAHLALLYENMYGHAVEVEWASTDGVNPVIVQIRPIQKKGLIAIPDIPAGDIIFKSDSIFGQADKKYDHIIQIDFPLSTFPEDKDIQSLSIKYPNSLFVYTTYIATGNDLAIANDILPYIDGLIVQDSNRDHITGTGLQHLALSCYDERKAIVWTDDNKIFRRIQVNSEQIERVAIYGDFAGYSVYKPKSPVRLAGDDEQAFAMLYFVK